MSFVEVIRTYWSGLLTGAKGTCEITLFVWVVGLSIGTLLGVLQSMFAKVIAWPTRSVSFVITSVPALVLVFWIHYPLQSMLGVQWSGFTSTVMALSLINVFGVADLVRPALDAFPRGYAAAGKVAGLSTREILWRIQIPIVARQILPALVGFQVIMLQASIFGSLVSARDILRVAQEINSRDSNVVQQYSVVALFFLVVCIPVSATAIFLQRKFQSKLGID